MMRVAVAADLMTSGMNGADQGRVPFRHPAEDEEGATHTGFRESVKHTQSAAINSRREIVPVPTRNTMIEAGHLEVIFDIDRQRVEQRTWSGGRGGLLLTTEPQVCFHAR